MTVLLLIRHGDNDLIGKKLPGRMPDVHLNARGQAQARRLAAGLAGWKIKAVLASPLERARETAEPIARVHGLEVETLPALLEINVGDFQGKSFKQLNRNRLWKTVNTDPTNFVFPRGESFGEAQQRIVAGLTEISERFGVEDRVVCAAHSDVVRLAVAHFLGLSLAHFQRLTIAPASLTVLHLQRDKVYFGPINYTFDLMDG